MMKERELLRALIVSGSEKGTSYLSSHLSPDRFHSPVFAAGGAQARRRLNEEVFDLVLINTPLPDEFGTELVVNLCEQSNLCALILVKSEVYESVSAKLTPLGALTVPKPVPHGALEQALQLACATRFRLQRVEQQNLSLKKRMDEIRYVNRAKWLLIRNLGMDEEQAHHFIEKQAMNLRQSKQQVAQTLIRTYDNETT